MSVRGAPRAPHADGRLPSAATATGQAATGQATVPSETRPPATGQAAQTPPPSATAQAPQAPLGRAGTVPVVAIGNAIVQCAAAVRAAGLMELAETGGAGERPRRHLRTALAFSVPESAAGEARACRTQTAGIV